MRRTRSLLVAILLLAPSFSLAQQTSLNADWRTNAVTFRGQVGRIVGYICPAGDRSNFGNVWGTDSYTDDSSICTAAVHAGVIAPDRGGLVRVAVRGESRAYEGSTRNGVQSQRYGPHGGTFSFDRSDAAIVVDWTTTAQNVPARFTTRLVVSCPPGGEAGAVWGTGTYTSDSSICSSAVHAGLASLERGGRFELQMTPGLETYAASSRNGIASRSFAAFTSSFSFPQAAVGTTTTTTSTTTATTTTQRVPLGTVDPAAVHATGFTAVAGYGNIELSWTAPPGAVGYRIAREAWDPAQQKWILDGTRRVPSAIGPDAVSSPNDLISSVVYLDGSLKPGVQYVYVLSTYFKSAAGNYYYADRATEPRATATPKDAASMSWLPSDWQSAPNLTKVQILSQQPGGKSTVTVLVEWQPKGGAAGYLVSVRESRIAFTRESKVCGSQPRPYLVNPSRPGTWYITLASSTQRTAVIELSENNIKLGILDEAPGLCIQVWAVYPNKINPATGSPDVMDAFESRTPSPGPDPIFSVKAGAIISSDAAAMFWADGLLQPWEIIPQSQIHRW